MTKQEREWKTVATNLARSLSMVTVECETLHHTVKDRHYSSTCPVEARIQKSLDEFDKLLNKVDN